MQKPYSVVVAIEGKALLKIQVGWFNRVKHIYCERCGRDFMDDVRKAINHSVDHVCPRQKKCWKELKEPIVLNPNPTRTTEAVK